MNYIFVNLKRFDVPGEFGGINSLCDIKDYSKTIAENVKESLKKYEDTEFGFFLPEAHLISAVQNFEGTNVQVGSQSVFRSDIEKGKNFGAFTTNRPASAVKALGCESTIIGHCEERNDLNELLSLGGNSDRNLVNTILNKEVKCAQKHGLKVLYCIGEKFEEMADWKEVLKQQLESGLDGCNLSDVVIAYEPVWSIGPGKTPADKDYITKVAKYIKSIYKDIPVVYGGGLKKDNAEMLSSIAEIDGGLIALTRFSGDIGFYPEEYLEIVDLYLKNK